MIIELRVMSRMTGKWFHGVAGPTWTGTLSKHHMMILPKGQRLTSASSASGLLQHKELFDSLLELTFESPTDLGLDVLWEGYPLRWKLGDLHAWQGTREPVTYPVAPPDDSASCYWAAAKRMVSEVDYVALFTWIKSIPNMWTNDFQTVYIYVDDRLLGDVHQRPFFLLAGQLVHVTWSCSFIIG